LKTPQYLIVPSKPKVFKVDNGFLTPISLHPSNGVRIRIDPDLDHQPHSIGVLFNHRIVNEPSYFDTLCFEEKDRIAIFQILPTENPLYGRLIFIKYESIEIFEGDRHRRRSKVHHGAL